MFRRRQYRLRLRSRTLVLGERTLVMGVLNITPDSFSDGGLHWDTEAAVARAFEIESQGADIIDIGAESTRPGSEGITAQEELFRLIPVLARLEGKLRIPISVDTSKFEVGDAAADAGAEILNDVTSLRNDPRIAEVARRRKLALVLMHMRGEPRAMQKKPFARDVLRDVIGGQRRTVSIALRDGVAKSQILLDPGIGFGKSYSQNYELLARLPELARLGYPLVVGPSRKGFIGRVLHGASVSERAWGTAATVAACILGGAHIVRVHDVPEMVQVARVTDAILNPQLVPAQQQELPERQVQPGPQTEPKQLS